MGCGAGVGLFPFSPQHSFMEIDHETFSKVILSILLSQGQLLHCTGNPLWRNTVQGKLTGST